MRTIGVLGGLGPAATVDFLDRLVQLTPARRDQDHIPVVAAFLPQVPDRSAGILGQGPDPLPALLAGIDLLRRGGVDLVAIPCNSAHHWHAQLSERARVPVLHIARACVQRLRQPPGTRVLVLATRGVQRSGFYRQALRGAGLRPVEPEALAAQDDLDQCIAQVKAGDPGAAASSLARILRRARSEGLSCAVLACTELPLAARHLKEAGLTLVDSTQALAQAAIEQALGEGAAA